MYVLWSPYIVALFASRCWMGYLYNIYIYIYIYVYIHIYINTGIDRYTHMIFWLDGAMAVSNNQFIRRIYDQPYAGQLKSVENKMKMEQLRTRASDHIRSMRQLGSAKGPSWPSPLGLFQWNSETLESEGWRALDFAAEISLRCCWNHNFQPA